MSLVELLSRVNNLSEDLTERHSVRRFVVDFLCRVSGDVKNNGLHTRNRVLEFGEDNQHKFFHVDVLGSMSLVELLSRVNNLSSKKFSGRCRKPGLPFVMSSDAHRREDTAMTETDDTWELIRIERLRVADEIQDLTAEQLATPSQCEQWTVAELAAHLITPFETSKLDFLRAMVRCRGNFDKVILRITDRVYRRHTHDEIVNRLRLNAGHRWVPPVKGAGPELPFAEIVVHGFDIRRPLGLPNTVPAETVERALAGIDDEATRADYARRMGLDQLVP